MNTSIIANKNNNHFSRYAKGLSYKKLTVLSADDVILRLKVYSFFWSYVLVKHTEDKRDQVLLSSFSLYSNDIFMAFEEDLRIIRV